MSVIKNPITGRDKLNVTADGVYNAITGRQVGIIENGVVKSVTTGAAIAVVANNGESIDLSFITAEAADILSGKVGADIGGNPVVGTIPYATVTETENSVTVSPGYVGEELNFERGSSGSSIDFYECSEVGTDSWSGYLMEQDGKGNWSATDQLRSGMPIQGFVPAVSYCYNENTTVIADLYSSDIFIQPFNVDAISYTGGNDDPVTWTYADGSIAYCSKYRNDWSIEEGGVFNIPAAGVPDSGYVEIAGNNNDFYWYFAWTNQSPVVVKGLQFMPGYDAQYGTVNFDVEGCDENSPDNSRWTTLARFTANKTTDYDKINYYSLKSNETAYKWYRIRVMSMNTLPYIAYLSVFSKDIKRVYGVV